MYLLIFKGIKKFTAWLVTGLAAGLAGASIVKVIVVGVLGSMLLVGLGLAGLLPPSPLQMAMMPLENMVAVIPYFRYVAFFIPAQEITAILIVWLQAVFGFHIVKAALRKGNVIK